ncbi:type III secretion inner membrane ring lipoprotein SctJ [Thalassomonas viridans]|uniref:Lipoprotein n=1 Tax=Thalassomonas viridans TaxID=137584 RepID=A0AAE9YX38_9GAMM|nr:type III secretion inner membrane ring lipoprotein SctJ [Thalassomonas viridans]WDE02796.1 type III secretion inner membrane ring lipoprotein SctJ [Thalassomonas viridans]
MNKFIRCVLVIGMLLSLTACKSVLYSNLSEKEANKMLAILLEANIAAQKSDVRDEMVSLLVEESQMSRAIELLKRAGLPGRKFADIVDVFPEDGLISTPTAERARFMFALSQGISHTLSQIDGVIDARVHVVIPKESSKRSKKEDPSTASVFIKHLADVALDNSIPQIKLLVSSSVEGLEYDNVNVVLFPTAEVNDNAGQAALEQVLSVNVDPGSVARFWSITLTLLLLLIASVAFNLYTWLQQRKQQVATTELAAATAE